MTEQEDHDALYFYLSRLGAVANREEFDQWLREASTLEEFYERELGKAQAFVAGFAHGWRERDEQG